jgi:hypothetical protein
MEVAMAGNRERGGNRRTVQLGTRVKRPGGGNGWYQFGAILFLVTVLCGLVLVTVAGARFARKVLFSENDRFRIQSIEIEDGRIKTEAMIREYLAYVGIAADCNLFAFDARELVSHYLERNPLARTMRIRRRLPGTLVVEIRERDPLVRMGQRGALVADREGFVFRLSSDLHRLPVIIGDKDADLAPGRTVQGMSRAAIEVLDACDNPRVGLRIVGVDVSRTDYLRVHVLTSDGIKEAKLAWEEMGRHSEASHANLLLRLAELRQVTQQDQAGHTEYNVTIPGRVFAR